MKLCISRCASLSLFVLLLVAAHAGHATNAIVLIDDLNPGEFGPGDPFSSLTEWPTDVDGLLFFTATRNIDPFTTESRLWVAGPEFMSATKLEGNRAERFVATSPSDLVRAGQRVFFAAGTLDLVSDPIENFGRELWFSDGTNEGTYAAGDLAPGFASSNPRNLAVLGDQIFFSADAQDGDGIELWKGDATAFLLVPQKVKDINPGAGSAIPRVATPIAVGNKLFFWADDGIHSYELWSTDGSSVGTNMVKDINPTPGASSIAHVANPAVSIGSRRHRSFNPVVIGSELYFLANDGISGVQIWQTDGTDGGTVLVTDPLDLDAPGFDANPAWLTAMGNLLFFTADTPLVSGRELWQYDTVSGVLQIVEDLNTGTASSRDLNLHDQMIVFDGQLYFAANHPSVGTALWRTTGAPGVIELFVDFDPLDFGTEAVAKLTVAGNLLYLAAGSDNGVELWETDGTIPNTTGIDINVGPGSSIALITGPRSVDLAASGGRIYVPANNGISGDELWVMLATPPFDVDFWRPGGNLPLPPQPQTDVAVELTSSRATVSTSAVYSYGLTVRNIGPRLAFGVEAEITLPVSGPNFLYEARSSLLAQPKCSSNWLTVTCDVGNLAVGASETFTLVVQAPATDGIVNLTADATSRLPDPNNFNNSDFDLTNVVGTSVGVDISVVKARQLGNVGGGRAVPYDLVVANSGTMAATGVQLTDVLPAGTTFQGVDSTPTDLCVESAGTVSCDIGNLASGSSVRIGINVLAPLTEGDFENTATATSNEADVDPSDNQSTTIVTVPEPGATVLALCALAVLAAMRSRNRCASSPARDGTAPGPYDRA